MSMAQNNEPTIDEMFAQIAKNQAAMLRVIESHEATIARLGFRIKRMEAAQQQRGRS